METKIVSDVEPRAVKVNAVTTAGYVGLVRDHRQMSPVRLFWQAAALRNATSALVRENRFMSFMVALIVALCVAPGFLSGVDAEILGLLAAEALAMGMAFCLSLKYLS